MTRLGITSATKQADRAAGIAGGHAGRPDPAASWASVCADGRAGQLGCEPDDPSRQLSSCAPTRIYPERGLQLNKPIGLRG